MTQTFKQDKKEFEEVFYKISEENSIEKIEKFLLTSKLKTFSQEYKQSVMDDLACRGYKNEKVAKWSLIKGCLGVRGDIHENCDRPLRLAVKLNTEFAKYLLTAPELVERADINATNDGSSAILNAIEKDNLEFVKYLVSSPELEVRARLDMADSEFHDPLCKACEEDRTEIVKYLLSDECYPEWEVFNSIKNLTRFDYSSILKIIGNDNLELLKFIVENKLLDIKINLNTWFCNAVIRDSRKVASYLEEFFAAKPDLTKLKYKDKSLFFCVAQANHYSRTHNHSFLQLMLGLKKEAFTPAEREEMSHFYVYSENDSAKKLIDVIDIYYEKINMEKNLVSKNITKEKSKI